MASALNSVPSRTALNRPSQTWQQPQKTYQPPTAASAMQTLQPSPPSWPAPRYSNRQASQYWPRPMPGRSRFCSYCRVKRSTEPKTTGSSARLFLCLTTSARPSLKSIQAQLNVVDIHDRITDIPRSSHYHAFELWVIQLPVQVHGGRDSVNATLKQCNGRLVAVHRRPGINPFGFGKCVIQLLGPPLRSYSRT